MAYARAPYFDAHIGPLERLLVETQYATLTELNLAMLRMLLDSLAISTPIVKASDYTFQGSKSDLVLDMCRQLGAQTYIFGAQGKNYADEAGFRAQGVEPYFQSYVHPTYRQQHGPFIPYMSVIDLLFNEGPAAREILLTANVTREQLPAGVAAPAVAN
jgi:hypothetical protein